MPVEWNRTVNQALDKPHSKQEYTHRRHNSKPSSHHDATTDLFIIPDQFITSKFETVRGWDIIERGDWIVHGTSDNSPDAAKNDAINNATQIGANGLIELDYYKTRGELGNYNYTIHNFRGRPVTLAKKNTNGVNQRDLLGLNDKADSLKKSLEAKKLEVTLKQKYAITCREKLILRQYLILVMGLLSTHFLLSVPLPDIFIFIFVFSLLFGFYARQTWQLLELEFNMPIDSNWLQSESIIS